MRVYLIQHGLALPEGEDPQRGLSEKGIVQTQKMAEFFCTRDINVHLIWHSQKLRSVQTAQIISQYITEAELVERKDLNAKDPVDKFPQEIKGLNKDLMIVGHLPFLQKLAAKMLAKSTHHDFILFHNSGAVCLEFDKTWKILWVIIPGMYL